MTLRLSPSAPDGFVVKSFASDDFKYCKDYVKSKLGLPQFDPAIRQPKPTPRQPKPTVASDDKSRIERARKIWAASLDPRGTIVETYLHSRALDLDDDVAGAVLKFHPACPWRDKDADKTIFVPAMIAAMRSITTDKITAIHRTWLSADGRKRDRRMLGVVAGAAIKLDADEDLLGGLHIGEGVETCLSARQLGLRPTWALGSCGAVGAFPVLGGVECLTLLAEHDDASARAVRACAQRWHAAGREVLINRPIGGKDLNDVTRRTA
jgi:hypothetical protein